MENEYAEAFKEERKEILFRRKTSDVAMLVATVLLMILSVSSVLWHSSALGLTACFDIYFAAVTVFLKKRGIIPGARFVLIAVLTLVCSAVFTTTSNASVKSLSFVALILSSLVWYAALSQKKYPLHDAALAEYIGSTAFRGFDTLPDVLKSLFMRKNGRTGKEKSVFIGLVAAIPVLLIVTKLLASSDAAFSSLLSSVGQSIGKTVADVIIGVIVSILAVGLVYSLKYKKYESKELQIPTVPTSGAAAFLCVLSSVYAVYLFSQLAYLFSAFKSILPAGYEFTYAEYARRGFFELCAIAAINLALLLCAIVFSSKNSGKLPKAIKIPCAFIAVFTLVIIATSISKMFMYIDVFGMTTLRVCTSAFMIWMAVVFIAALARLFIKRLDVLAVALAAGLIVLSVLGIGNVNRFAAKYNYEAHVANEKAIDVGYMAKLGDEGVEYLYLLTKDENKKTASAAKKELEGKISEYYETESGNIAIIKIDNFDKLVRKRRGPMTFSVPSEKAYETFEKYYAEVKG